MNRKIEFLILGFVALLIMGIGFFFEQLNFQVGGLFLFAILALVFITIPDRTALFIFSIYVCWEGVAKILTSYNPIIHVGPDLLIVFFVVRVLVFAVIGKVQLSQKLPSFTAVIATHYTWFLIAFFNPGSMGLIPSIAGAKVYVTMTFLYFFGYYLVKNAADARFFMRAWMIAAVGHGLTALYQFSVGPQSVTSIHPGYSAALAKFAGTLFRPFGLANQPGAPALYMMLATPFFLLSFVTAKKMMKKLAIFPMFPIIIAVLIACQVRSVFVMTLLASAVFLFLYSSVHRPGRARFNPRSVLLVAGTLGTIFFLMPIVLKELASYFPESLSAFERMLTIYDMDHVKGARGAMGNRFFTYLTDIPFGAGLSKTGAAAGRFMSLFDEQNKLYFTDNLILAIQVDLGIPGLIILMTIFLGVGLKIMSELRFMANHEYRMINSAIFAAFLVMYISWYGSEAFIYNPATSFFWFFSGIGMKLIDLDRDEVQEFYRQEAERQESLAEQPLSEG